MIGYSVEIAPGAESDITDAFHWYRERSILVADTFRSEVFSAINRIAKTPLANATNDEGNRKHVLRRFPYSMFYEIQVDTVMILAVAHHRRKPSYWRSKKT